MICFASSPEELVQILEGYTGQIEDASPKRLRVDEAKKIVESIVHLDGVDKYHLERIIDTARRFSDFLWDDDGSSGLKSIELKKTARLYDSIIETAQRRLNNLVSIQDEREATFLRGQ